VAGTGTSGSGLNELNFPAGIYVDETDNEALYIADSNNNRVMKWPANAASGTIVAGGNGPGSDYTQLLSPYDVVLDSSGTVYVSDLGNNRIMQWAKGATNATLVAGTGISGNAPFELNMPIGIRFDTNGNLYVADSGNNRIQRFTIDSTTAC